MTLVLGGVAAGTTLSKINLDLDERAIIMPAALALGGIVLLLQLIRRRSIVVPSVAVPVAALLTVYLTVVFLGIPILERSRPTARLGRWVTRHTAVTNAIGAYGLDDWRASIRYYVDRPVTPLRAPEDVRAFFDTSRMSYMMMRRVDFDELRRSGIPLIEVSRRRAIIGRSGKYVRRQVWGDLLIVTHRDNADAFAFDASADDPER